MNEDILSFIWQFQYFDNKDLLTDGGQAIRVLQTGHRNASSGPDFSGARIDLDRLTWVGDVEIHVNASDWHRHNHDPDPAYESVILHVVWTNDQPIRRADGTLIPTLTLDGKVRQSVLQRYFRLVDSQNSIPCADQFGNTALIDKYGMLDRVLLERLARKADDILALWTENLSDWEETSYQVLGQHFGFKLNDAPFFQLCKAIPWRVMRMQNNQVFPIEALLFGQSGLLPAHPKDDYGKALRSEHRFLVKKYRLGPAMEATEWRFLGLRPVGFPTIRIAQFAQFLACSPNIFAGMIHAARILDFQRMFKLRQTEYWTLHHHFEKPSGKKIAFMGRDASNNLIINVAVPLLTAYSRSRKLPEYLDRALAFLTDLPPENNRITRLWESLEMRVSSASDSQGLLEWYGQYCSQKRCLSCNIGAKIIRQI
ncbi:DUF2851 family protein [Dyadobacter tibetensis]|uniref:DUF2851 family protein n=1 Tax=Dyadobacter tibetensis TaxID=1211851 RepID=UPI00046F24BC|nr:DUF2851 family protein [Dyadobacter tibetensis]